MPVPCKLSIVDWREKGTWYISWLVLTRTSRNEKRHSDPRRTRRATKEKRNNSPSWTSCPFVVGLRKPDQSFCPLYHALFQVAGARYILFFIFHPWQKVLHWPIRIRANKNSLGEPSPKTRFFNGRFPKLADFRAQSGVPAHILAEKPGFFSGAIRVHPRFSASYPLLILRVLRVKESASRICS